MMTATKPQGAEEAKASAVKHNFKTAADGRFIITMDDDEVEKKAAKKGMCRQCSG